MSEIDEPITAAEVQEEPAADAGDEPSQDVPQASSEDEAPEHEAETTPKAKDESEAEAEPEAAKPAPAKPVKKPAAARPAPDPVSRQALPCQGGQCSMRIGKGAIESLGREAKTLAGKPRLALLVMADDVRPQFIEKIRRQLADAEFQVADAEVESGVACCDLSHAGKLFKRMAKAGLTGDDVIVAVGDSDVLSLSAFVAGMWCGGTPLIMVPTDLLACVEPPLTPRSLDVKGLDEAIRIKAHPKVVFCDTAEFDVNEGDAAPMVRAIAVATAMADNQNSLNRLIGRADALVAGDENEIRTQVFDTMKGRARMAMSASIAVRQGLTYGRELAAILARHLPKAAPSALLAEGMRFSSRLAISVEESTDIDTVFAQDALLDRMGLHEVPCDLDPVELARELRDERFKRSNRFLVTVPLGFGKVRLTSVPEDVLLDHLTAFCAARRALL